MRSLTPVDPSGELVTRRLGSLLLLPLLLIGCAAPIELREADESISITSKDTSGIDSYGGIPNMNQLAPLDVAIDAHRGEVDAWAHVTRIQRTNSGVTCLLYTSPSPRD